jgi:SagB-type dehydrogenase family enzyme
VTETALKRNLSGMVWTVPCLFLHPRRDTAIVWLGSEEGSGARLSSFSFNAWRLAFRCLEPTTTEALVAEGYALSMIERALHAGILTSGETRGDHLWEMHGWSRAAYLTFSQMDLEYVEPLEADLTILELADLRRSAVQSMIREEPYPVLIEPQRILQRYELPTINKRLPRLDTLLTRRTQRRFSAEPLSLETLATVLFQSTSNLRLAAEQQVDGDPYDLLNSYQTWLHVYVVAQAISGIPPGAYRYDALGHELQQVANEEAVAEVKAAVHHQPWAGGTGAAIFVVAQWDRYYWLYRHSRGYISVLMQAAEFAQEVLHYAYEEGCGGWVTPAVHESRAVRILRLDPSRQDAIYFIKVGLVPGAGAS